jgi:signal transduction histidine kinase
LNFVNNFADLSQELAEELLALVDQEGPLDRDEARDLCKLLQDNVTKIASHGKRADGIVRAMLLHSRGKAGDMVESNINTVVDEHCTLAYHGLRARDASVRVDVERHLSEAVKPFLCAPQDMARVILNLVGNACEAAWERARGDDAHPAKVTVRTEPWEKGVRITVRDNGPGVPLDLQKKIFEPFFTTKPPGVGTGLGLSISFDILRAHGGELRLESVPGDYAEFQVYLPYEGASAPMGQR